MTERVCPVDDPVLFPTLQFRSICGAQSLSLKSRCGHPLGLSSQGHPPHPPLPPFLSSFLYPQPGARDTQPLLPCATQASPTHFPPQRCSDFLIFLSPPWASWPWQEWCVRPSPATQWEAIKNSWTENAQRNVSGRANRILWKPLKEGSNCEACPYSPWGTINQATGLFQHWLGGPTFQIATVGLKRLHFSTLFAFLTFFFFESIFSLFSFLLFCFLLLLLPLCSKNSVLAILLE